MDGSDAPHPWQLQVHIPEPVLPEELRSGRLLIRQALGGTRIIPLRSIQSVGIRVAVSPQLLPYKIEGIEVEESDWMNRISVVPALSSQANVFHTGLNGGRRLNDKEPITWGKSYVLLWDEANPIKTPVFLHSQELNLQDSWIGQIVYLPKTYDSVVAKWVLSVLGRPIIPQQRTLILMSPVPLNELADGTLVVPTDQEVIIGTMGGQPKSTLTLLFTGEGITRKIQLVKADDMPCVFRFGHLNDGMMHLWIENEPDCALHLLARTSELCHPSFPKVSLVTSGSENEIFLHADGSVKKLQNVRDSGGYLTQVNLPPRVSMKVVSSEFDEPLELTGGSDDEAYERTLAFINEVMHKKEIPITFDAGAFGNLTLEGSTPKSVGQVRMSAEWRRKVSWVLGLSETGWNRHYSVIHRLIRAADHTFMERLDIRLLRMLSQKSSPPELDGHVINLLAECRRLVYERVERGRTMP
ncbi:hypothetical protein [Ferroacidibacillus organovorans]|uniref:Uncharacterized protein n=1 Tax=Ferroacidibacillus organovorans TaxID=1765683 RepID=A0A101XRE8_9BACL|nr:hypothetical protein [Ferroacidibacillus organovorans]KUO96131.1 hypothetical protein ATW55_14455 [Ferroacidibacillus organovorans]